MPLRPPRALKLPEQQRQRTLPRLALQMRPLRPEQPQLQKLLAQRPQEKWQLPQAHRQQWVRWAGLQQALWR